MAKWHFLSVYSDPDGPVDSAGWDERRGDLASDRRAARVMDVYLRETFPLANDPGMGSLAPIDMTQSRGRGVSPWVGVLITVMTMMVAASLAMLVAS